jgi:alpha-D-ribose 1-methylphosphonate 5-triphosphate synthase subunit PhnI
MYVAVKGGAAAIEASWQLLAQERRGDPAVPELTVAQVREQLRLAVDRVMTEGSLYDPELAALALKQAQGDAIEAVFLLRAYRTTLARFGASLPLDTACIALKRRISATFKDVPGGQMLGSTYDYTQRLLDFNLLADGAPGAAATASATASITAAATVAEHQRGAPVPRISTLLRDEGLLEPAPAAQDVPLADVTREPLLFPADRATRLQALARGDEGWLLALGYSTQRGYANGHPFAGEIRRGLVAVEFVPDELGFALDIGDIEITECQMVNQFAGNKDTPPQFTVGYGLAFGGAERKAIAMALVDRALRAAELQEPIVAPAQDEEFVLAHCDSVESSGFVQHLKLPHYVDFQSELELVRKLRAAHADAPGAAADGIRREAA